MSPPHEPYYRPALAAVHDRGFGSHADACAPGMLARLEPVRQAGGVVLELGCGSGHLTRHLVEAGHQVIASDASPAMLELVAGKVPGVKELRQLTLSADPLPSADAIVSVGHVLNYLPDEAAIRAALAAIADALRPGGVLVADICDLRFGRVRQDQTDHVAVTDDWVLITRYSRPDATRYVRAITCFIRDEMGAWQRDDERHDNVLIDTATIPPLLAGHAVHATIEPSFGGEPLPEGLVAVIGTSAPP